MVLRMWWCALRDVYLHWRNFYVRKYPVRVEKTRSFRDTVILPVNTTSLMLFEEFLLGTHGTVVEYVQVLYVSLSLSI